MYFLQGREIFYFNDLSEFGRIGEIFTVMGSMSWEFGVICNVRKNSKGSTFEYASDSKDKIVAHYWLDYDNVINKD